jgi:tetratricopeptide (TPR) repeat protein
MRFARGLLLLALGLLWACHRSGRSAAEHKHAPPARLTIVTDRLALEGLEKLPLDEARRVRPDVFRLRPDRRFLMALGEAELLTTRAASVRLHVSWRDDAWHIDSSGVQIGTLPEVASFIQLREVLAHRSSGLVGAWGTAISAKPSDLAEVRAECDRFEPSAAIRALRRIDALWPTSGRPDPELSALGGRAFLVLCVQGLDTLEMADLLRARALALLALAEALGRSPETADEALLAASAGYGPDAIRIAQRLPSDDPVRLYVEGRTSALVEAAERGDATRRTQYLALLSLGTKGDQVAWSKFHEAWFGREGFSLPILRAASNLKTFSMDSQLGAATLYAALADMPGPPSPPTPAIAPELVERFDLARSVVARFIGLVQQKQRVESAGLVRQFESSLEKAAAGAHGPLWDVHATRAWHRGAFYSGLHLIGWHYLDQLGTVDETREFAAYLQGSPEGPGAQFAEWYGDVSAILSGSGVTDRCFDDLVSLTALGSPSVHRLAPELRSTYYHKRDASGVIAARVAGRLDARPANVAFMQTIAAYPLQDFRMVERLCRSWLEQGWANDPADPGTAGHCLWYTGDTTGLSRLLSDHRIDVQARGELLYRYALSPNSPEKFCRTAFERLAIESGYAESVVQGWSYYLQHKPVDYAGAQRVVEAWLAHHDPSSFSGLFFLGRRARLISLQGRPEEAWRVIQPAIERGGQLGVLTWGADILMKLGRLDEAYTLARQTVERYPSSPEGREALAEILWRQKRYSEAAFVLDPPEESYKVGEDRFRDDLPSRFGGVFAKAPDDAVLSAFQALQGQGIEAQRCTYLLSPIADAGRNNLAFRVQSTLSLKRPTPWGLGEKTLRGFQFLEKAKGEPDAIDWARNACPKPQREMCNEAFFNKKAWNLVWDAVPPGEEAQLSEWVWLMRAGAAVADEKVARAHRAALLDHYRDPKPGDASVTIGRYLSGLGSRQAVLGAASVPVDRCKAAYFFGLEEIARGRYEEGSDWYQLVYDTCGNTWAWRLVSFTWSTMNEWYAFDQNLRAASANHVW